MKASLEMEICAFCHVSMYEVYLEGKDPWNASDMWFCSRECGEDFCNLAGDLETPLNRSNWDRYDKIFSQWRQEYHG